MLPRDELLESIDILVQHAVKETTQIYTALVTAVNGNSCTIRVNGRSHSGIAYYGEAPTVNKSYRVFAPNGSMNQAFIITGGGSGGLASLPIASATQLGGIKVGAGLTINDSGTLSATGGGTADAVEWKNVQDKPTTIGGYGITDAKISGNNIILGTSTMTPYTGSNPPPYPVTSVNGQTGDVTIDTGGNVDSVNGKTGDVVLDASDVGALPSTTVIPSKTSQLTNDSGYVNSAQAKNAAPVQSVDGATGDVVTNAVKTTEQSLTDAQKQQARENISAGTSSFDGNYNSLSNKPTIPTKVSQLENDSDYATESQVDAKYTKPTSGIPKSDLSSDVQASLNKANTALQSAPVTSVNNKTGAVQLTAADVGALPNTTKIPSKTSDIINDSGYITEADVPTKTSELTNDSGFITSADVPVKSVNGKTGAVQLEAFDVGALPDTTVIPSKTSDLVNNSGFITSADVPTKVSELDNDSGYITDAALSPYAKKTDVPTKTSQLTNDSGFITSDDVPNKVSELENDSGYITNSALTPYAKKTDIPTKTSQLTNDSGYITDIPIASSTRLGGVKVGAGLTVSAEGTISATGGGTADAVEWDNVLDKPTTIAGYGITDAKISNGTITLGNQSVTPLTEAPVTSVDGKTGAVTTDAIKYIAQSLTTAQKQQARANIGAGTSSFSGSYNDLSGKPTIPSATSDLTNDSGFITEADVPVKSVDGKTGAVVTGVADKVSKSGDTMTGDLTVGSASLQTNGYVTGTWLKTTADTALSSAATKIAVLSSGWVYSRTPSQIKSDIGLGNVDNVKQYSVSNPPPYPVTSVNGQTGAVTVEADLPDGLVKYIPLANIQATTPIDANTLQGHNAAYFATQSGLNAVDAKVTTNANNISTLQTGLSTLQSGKLDKSGGTMTGALVAQTNTSYTTRQVRNIIISTEEPSGGQNGDIWIRYAE